MIINYYLIKNQKEKLLKTNKKFIIQNNEYQMRSIMKTNLIKDLKIMIFVKKQVKDHLQQ